MPLTVGTAGHIDHGKTWLVRALTGKDTDRLPEEQQRGISIDLGYAPLELPDGRRLSLVDVPGHERFVRNMVAGATGIDLFLLVIDAAEGARPQTHEHLAILRLLGIERGVVAVTKADAVDEETLELAVAEATRARARGRGRRGQREDRARGSTSCGRRSPRAADRAEHAHHDGPDAPLRRPGRSRCAGSAPSSPARSGRGRSARATSCGSSRPGSTRGCAASRCTTARSTARRPASGSRSRCPGIERDRISRGDALVAAGRLPRHVPARRRARGDRRRARRRHRPPRHRRRPRAGRAQRPVRAAPARERPVVAARGDRVVLRTASTVGGGVVLDPLPPRRLDPERLERLERGEAGATVYAPVRAETLGHLGEIEGVERAGDWVYSPEWLEELRAELAAAAGRGRPARPRDRPARPRRGRRRSSRCSGSSGAARGSTSRARPPSVDGADELLAELESSGSTR